MGVAVSCNSAHNARPILVSACLIGQPCRFDGASKPCSAIVEYAKRHAVVSICPEQLGGLPTPRVPSEIRRDGRVVDKRGVDRTEAFDKGAAAAVRIARKHGCKQAVLKARSPSCGIGEVYDGTFSGTLVAGDGKAACALRKAGVAVMSEEQFVAVGLKSS